MYNVHRTYSTLYCTVNTPICYIHTAVLVRDTLTCCTYSICTLYIGHPYLLYTPSVLARTNGCTMYIYEHAVNPSVLALLTPLSVVYTPWLTLDTPIC